MMKLTARVLGRVQGVSFRYATRRVAHGLNLKGWVKNEKDGSVTVVAQGEKTRLETLLKFLSVGPPAAIVNKVEIEWSRSDNDFRSFIILWT